MDRVIEYIDNKGEPSRYYLYGHTRENIISVIKEFNKVGNKITGMLKIKSTCCKYCGSPIDKEVPEKD